MVRECDATVGKLEDMQLQARGGVKEDRREEQWDEGALGGLYSAQSTTQSSMELELDPELPIKQRLS